MTRILACLLYLYPREWRHRYGAELLALSEDAQLKWSDPLDIAKGAFTMRLDNIRSKPVWRIVLALTVAGAISGGVVTQFMRTRYVSTAVLFMDVEPSIGSKRLHELYMRASTRRELTALIQAANVYPELQRRIPLENVVEQFKRDLRLSNAQRPGRTLQGAGLLVGLILGAWAKRTSEPRHHSA